MKFALPGPVAGMQVGDWEEALEKFKASQEESLAVASAQAAALENRAMSLAEGLASTTAVNLLLILFHLAK